MKLLANTVLCHNNNRMGYEILRMRDVLLFQPYYHRDQNFPCIVLSRYTDGWRFQESLNESMESQVLEDIQCLKGNHRTAASVN